MSIKKYIKRTSLYLMRQEIKTYRRKERRIGKNISKIQSVTQMKSIKYYGNNAKDVCKQVRITLEKCKLQNCFQGDLFYSIDETCIMLHTDRMIGNIPIDYSVIVNNSIAELRERNALVNNDISKQNDMVLDIIEQYIGRICNYIRNSDAKNRNDIAERIAAMKSKKAFNLIDALQRILFINQILWQTNHKLIGLGRLDKILEQFPIEENTEEIIKDFLTILHSYYNFKSSVLLGDTGQVIVLGGKEANGEYFCNAYTYLFIKCVRELGIPDPKILLRVSENMPNDLLGEAIDTIATGGGSPLLSNDDVVIPAIEKFDYEQEDAYNYGVSACWEPLIPGKSLEQNNLANIEFGEVIVEMMQDDEIEKCNDFDKVLILYKKHLENNVQKLLSQIDSINWYYDPLLTLFTKGCLDKNQDISQGGAYYSNYGILSIGMSTAVNSLLNIKRYAYTEKRVLLSEIRLALKNDYIGYKELYELFRENKDGFGTSNVEAISLTQELMDVTEVILKEYRNKFNGKVKFGLSSPAYLRLGKKTCATADGRLAGTPMNTHISRDRSDSITDIMLFAGKLNYEGRRANASVVDIFVQPNLIHDNKEKFCSYILGGIKAGFFQMQFNVLSYQQLCEAKKYPERYPELIVRVWGFSAYFNDLPEEYKDLLIERAKAAEENV